jgi:hypothetical protein
MRPRIGVSFIAKLLEMLCDDDECFEIRASTIDE